MGYDKFGEKTAELVNAACRELRNIPKSLESLAEARAPSRNESAPDCGLGNQTSGSEIRRAAGIGGHNTHFSLPTLFRSTLE